MGAVAAAILVSLAVSQPASAQPSMSGPPPELMAKMKKWQQWGDSHKSLSRLQAMIVQVAGLDKEPGSRLSPQQAGKFLGIMKMWSTKPTMSDDQAKQVSKQIGAMLTTKQIQKMATMSNPFGQGAGGGMGGMRPGGGAGAGGRMGGGPGGMKIPDPPKGGYNPFNADTMPFPQTRPMIKKMQQDFMTQLQSRAK